MLLVTPSSLRQVKMPAVKMTSNDLKWRCPISLPIYCIGHYIYPQPFYLSVGHLIVKCMQ